MMSPRTDPVPAATFTYNVITIGADIAYIEAHGDAQLYRVTLVKLRDRWLVAGENNTPDAIAR